MQALRSTRYVDFPSQSHEEHESTLKYDTASCVLMG